MRNKDKIKFGTYSNKFLGESRRTCKCGHSINFVTNATYIICSFCGSMIFKDKKAEFDYKIKRTKALKRT